jgi:hypothetical protein
MALKCLSRGYGCQVHSVHVSALMTQPTQSSGNRFITDHCHCDNKRRAVPKRSGDHAHAYMTCNGNINGTSQLDPPLAAL